MKLSLGSMFSTSFFPSYVGDLVSLLIFQSMKGAYALLSFLMNWSEQVSIHSATLTVTQFSSSREDSLKTVNLCR